MKKKLSFVLSLVVISLVLISTGCSAKKTAEEALLEDGRVSLSEFLKTAPERDFSVKKKSDGTYRVEIDGEVTNLFPPEGEQEDVKPKFVQECTDKKVLKLVKRSKSILGQYIDSSNVLKDKEKLVQFIDQLEVKTARIDSPAMFNPASGIVYIASQSQYQIGICEWSVVHELVHALAFKTNDGIENEPYAFKLFNEVVTDLITASMDPHIPQGINSGYKPYADLGLTYVGIFQEDALRAYFYGYADIWETVGKDEFDTFVLCLDNYDAYPVTAEVVNCSLAGWAKK